jgi:low affinity Fe/Cu permease
VVPPRPSELRTRRTGFDQFAERASHVVGQAAFFIAALLGVVVWIPTVLIFRSVDTWQLVISTITSVLAFLLVALLQNSARRTDVALHRKIDALSEALIAILANTPRAEGSELDRSLEELRAAVGLEERL